MKGKAGLALSALALMAALPLACPAQPVIAAIAPASGYAGGAFVISGSGLGSDAAYQLVLYKRVNNTDVVYTVLSTSFWNEERIESGIPASLEPGSYLIGIWERGMNRYLASVAFAVLEPSPIVPAIETVAPERLYSGGLVTVTGKHFADPSRYQLVLCREGVSSEGVAVKVVKWLDTEIIAALPNLAGRTATQYALWLWDLKQPANKHSNNMLYPVAIPSIERAEPQILFLGEDNALALGGRNFGRQEYYYLKFGNLKKATAESWSDGAATVALAAAEIAEIGTGPCTITLVAKNGDFPVSSNFAGVQVKRRPPLLQGVDPAEALPGSAIRVSGGNLMSNNLKGNLVLSRDAAKGGGIYLKIASWTPGEIAAVLPDKYQAPPGQYYLYIHPEDVDTPNSNLIALTVLPEAVLPVRVTAPRKIRTLPPPKRP